MNKEINENEVIQTKKFIIDLSRLSHSRAKIILSNQDAPKAKEGNDYYNEIFEALRSLLERNSHFSVIFYIPESNSFSQATIKKLRESFPDKM
jgi:hypothetical protein